MTQVEVVVWELDDVGVSVVVRCRLMQLSPRYDGPPVFEVDGAADDQREPVTRQRRRLQDALASLTDDQWLHSSRCEGWTIQDVVNHLIGTNRFWTVSIQAGLAGSPTRILAAFDPAATPALMVEPMRSMSPAETLAEFVESNQELFDAVESLDLDGWSTIGESPAGHVSMRMLANHALWDSWIHERDILVPLDIAPVEEPDEIESCLRYVAAVAPVLGLALDPTRRGALAIDATDPDVYVVIEVGTTVIVRQGEAPKGALRLSGRSVDLIDSLSIRAPLRQTVPDDSRWLIEGLATVFDTEVQPA